MAKAPPLLSDDDYMSSSASEDDSFDSEDDEVDWPYELRKLMAKKPRRSDYDANGQFHPHSDYFTQSDEEKEVLGVTTVNPLHTVININPKPKAPTPKTAPATQGKQTPLPQPPKPQLQPPTSMAEPPKPQKHEPKRKNTPPPAATTKKEPLIVQPEPASVERSYSEEKVHTQINDKLSKGWRNVMDGENNKAIVNYDECIFLFTLLTTPHTDKSSTLICQYILYHHRDLGDSKSDEIDKIYDKIKSINEKDIPFVNFIHIKHALKQHHDPNTALPYFAKLNNVLHNDVCTEVFYPLSKQRLKESHKDFLSEYLKKYLGMVTSYHDKYAVMKCVSKSCKTRHEYILDYETMRDPYNVLECSDKCLQYYHHACFKHIPKWNLDDTCSTPDCQGSIIKMYENGKLRREYKHIGKKGPRYKTTQPPQSPRTKKKSRRHTDTGNSTSSRDADNQQQPPPPPPSPTPPSPTPLDPAPPSPEPTGPTGDDIIDMFGTMLIYIEEFPGSHITTVTMELNAVYPWIKVDLIHQFVQAGVQSYVIQTNGTLMLRVDTDEEKELRKENDINLLIKQYKDCPMNIFKQSLETTRPSSSLYSREPDPLSNTVNQKKADQAESKKEGKMYKRNKPSAAKMSSTSASGSANRPPDILTLNPGATEFTFSMKHPVDPYTGVAYTAASPTNMPGSLASATPNMDRYQQIPQRAPVIGSPIPQSYTERKALAERIASLEETMAEMKHKYERELDHYKTQLCDQIESFSKIKAKAKVYKQDYKIAADKLTDQTKLKSNYDKLVKQIEDERRTWLSERESKSVESKKLILQIRIELEDQKKTNDESKSQIIQKTREMDELREKLELMDNMMFKKDTSSMDLKRENIDLTQKYRLTQQYLVQEKFNMSKLKLRIAYANCEAQIGERQRVPYPEAYNLSAWRVCQDDIRNKIDDNQVRYDEYVDSLHNSHDPEMVRFEQEPNCPRLDDGVEPIYLQRFEDILLGRPAPLLPDRSLEPSIADNEMDVLASLMSDTPPLTSSTPALPPSTDMPHFEFDTGDTSNSYLDQMLQSSRPPLTTSRPPSEPIRPPTDPLRPPSVPLRAPSGPTRPPSDLPIAPPDQHFEFIDFPSDIPPSVSTRAPQATIPAPSRHPVPVFADMPAAAPQPGGSVINRTNSSASSTTELKESAPPSRGRGRSRSRAGPARPIPHQVAQSTPAAPIPAAPIPAAPVPTSPNRAPIQNKGALLKKTIKDNHPQLTDREITRYLCRVKEEHSTRVTTQFVIQRIGELVSADYAPQLTSPTPDNTCVICTDALDAQHVTRLGCGHDFHRECVNKWFSTQNHTCPTCRSHQPPADMFPPLS